MAWIIKNPLLYGVLALFLLEAVEVIEATVVIEAVEAIEAA